MKTCLVSLVSDQTIPNILVAAHFRPDFLLFISTTSMEKKGKSQAILEALRQRGMDYSNAYQKLEVSEDSVINLQTEVSAWLDQAGKEYHFIVNLTGGNKLMAIASFDLFSGYDSVMGYVPIPKNEFLIPFPKKRPKPSFELLDRLSVAEYLTAYGFRITNRNFLEENKSKAFARHLTSKFIFNHYQEVQPFLKWLWERFYLVDAKQFKKGYDFSDNFEVKNEVQEKLISDLVFQREGSTVSKKINESEWHYLRGGWLEERLFLAVSESLGKKADVQLNLHYQDLRNNINELDVLFTYENTLYLVECKSLNSAEGSEDRVGITDFLYKLGALRQNFGLTPKAFLATTSGSVLDDKGRVKPHLMERGNQFGIKIIPLLQISDLEKFFKKNLIDL